MKTISTLLFLVLSLSFQINAQLPNADFETWVNGQPESWFTTNIQGIAVPITKTTDAYSGTSAARGEVVSYFNSVVSPILQVGNFGAGLAVSQQYKTFKGYFKFNPIGGDQLIILIVCNNGTQVVGAGEIETTSAINSYTELNVPISYTGATIPNVIYIRVLIAGPSEQDPHVGSVYFADNFSLSTEVTDVTDPSKNFTFRMDQNYPNPFNPVTNIRYSLPSESQVTFTVYNALGNEVHKETFFRTSGEHDLNFKAEGLSSGIYFYNISAGTFSATKKFVLMK